MSSTSSRGSAHLLSIVPLRTRIKAVRNRETEELAELLKLILNENVDQFVALMAGQFSSVA